MTGQSFLAFILIMSAAIVTPGPTVLFALNNAASFGMRCAMIGMMGSIAADVALILFVGLSLDMVLSASHALFMALKWIGAAWLAYMGISLLRSSGSVDVSGAARERPAGFLLLAKGFLLAASNPKYYLFLAAILPQFIDSSSATMPQYAALAMIVVAIDVLVMAGYAALGRRSALAWKRDGVKWMERVSGTFLIILAGSVLLA